MAIIFILVNRIIVVVVVVVVIICRWCCRRRRRRRQRHHTFCVREEGKKICSIFPFNLNRYEMNEQEMMMIHLTGRNEKEIRFRSHTKE